MKINNQKFEFCIRKNKITNKNEYYIKPVFEWWHTASFDNLKSDKALQKTGLLPIHKKREKRQGDKMTDTNIYIFDVAHYLEWCKMWSLNKNSAEVLRLFKSRCDFERVLKEITKI